MPQFDVSTFYAQLIWLFIVFGSLYYIVSKLIAPRVESILTNRNSYVEENINNAQECNDKVKSLEILRREQLDQMHLQAESVQKKSIDIINAKFEQKQLELSQMIEIKRKNSLISIQNYINRFHEDSEQYSIKVAAFIIEKITNKEADITLLKKIYSEK
ncbi:MAG: hypothetical protein EKK61_06575 [Rickettsiales bacterium]|nr:MAG: hypothetical protein EKK61_06575 [Rickettsiales bacterium]